MSKRIVCEVCGGVLWEFKTIKYEIASGMLAHGYTCLHCRHRRWITEEKPDIPPVQPDLFEEELQ